jgi:hypothetical protein
MIRVSIEVNNSGGARSDLCVRAESIRRAVSIVKSVYPDLHPVWCSRSSPTRFS